MKWRRVKPNPCEFFWRKMVLGPCHDTPSTSPDDSGRRLFSLDDTMPSLRPLACWEDGENVSMNNSLPLGPPQHRQSFTMRVLKCVSRIIFRRLQWTCLCDCGSPHSGRDFKEVYGGGCGCICSIHSGLPRSNQSWILSMPGISQRLPLCRKETLFSPTTSTIITFINCSQQ